MSLVGAQKTVRSAYRAAKTFVPGLCVDIPVSLWGRARPRSWLAGVRRCTDSRRKTGVDDTAARRWSLFSVSLPTSSRQHALLPVVLSHAVVVSPCWQLPSTTAVRRRGYPLPLPVISPYASDNRVIITITTRRSQHSQECKHPRRHFFCNSWPWPLTFWPQNKWISRTHRGTFVCQVWWCYSCIDFWDRAERQTDTQTNGGENCILATAVVVGNYQSINRSIDRSID